MSHTKKKYQNDEDNGTRPGLLRRLHRELSPTQKVASALVAIAGAIVVLYNAWGIVEQHWVLSTVYAMDTRAFNQRLDRTDLVILEGQLSNVQGDIVRLEANPKLTDPEKAYLGDLKKRADALREQIADIKSRLKKYNEEKRPGSTLSQ
jgi:hypothetical protein